MTPTTTVPSPCPEIVPGSEYHYLNETFQKLVKLKTLSLKSILTETPWIHFLQYSNIEDKIAVSSLTSFENACWGNRFMPQEYKNTYYSKLLTDEKLLLQNYYLNAYSGINYTFKNLHTRLVWLAIKESFSKPGFNQNQAYQKILSAGGVTEDVLLDIFECIKTHQKHDFVRAALNNTTANIPSRFIDYIASVGIYLSDYRSDYRNVHIPRTLQILNQLDTKQINYEVWKLAAADNLCEYVAGCINDYCTKSQNTISTPAGNTTDSGGSNVSIGESIPDHFTRIAAVSN